jgi:hypothetical protein
MALCFLRANSPAVYLLLAMSFLVCAGASAWRHRDKLAGWMAWTARYRIDAMIIWFALGLLLAFTIRPIENVDSLANLHSVMGWVQNKTTPYEYANYYVPFWELSYVPALVLTHSDVFYWFNSLKPVLLLALLMFLIARELELPDRLAIWTIAALLFFPHLWLGPSGVSTIKNDMICAAGYMMAALAAVRAVRGKSAAMDVALAALAAAFVSEKSSGPVALIVGGAVVLLVAGRKPLCSLRSPAGLIRVAVAAAFWFVAVGHFYLHNLLDYGNPVYPYQINFGPIHFPGLADLSGTSILYSLHDARMWRYLFLPEGRLSDAGVFFPIMLAAILILSVVLVVAAVWRKHLTALSALALFELVAWFVYARSIYSASGWPGDLAYLANDLNSVRYVEGPLLVGALCLVWALYRLGAPRAVIALLLAAQAASSFAILLRRAPDHPWVPGLFFGAALALFSLAMRGRWTVPMATALVAISLLAGAQLMERRRPLWLTALQPLYRPLYDAPPQQLFYLIDQPSSAQAALHFPFLGHHLQHDADSGSLARLLARATPPSHVAWTRATPDAPTPELPGYRIVVNAAAGALWERR